MHLRTIGVAILLLLLVMACSKKKVDGKGGACYGNNTCDDGLTCLSKLCVKQLQPIDRVAAAIEEMCACQDIACFEGKMESAKADLNEETMRKLNEHRPEEMRRLTDELRACSAKMKAKPGLHQRKSKTVEALQFIKKMSDAARTYYSVPEYLGHSPSAGPAEKSFPEPAGPTPPLGTCCKDGGKCAPNAAYWEHPTWYALNFYIADPHYYSYEFRPTVATDDAEASYTVIAHGDLDCDGEYSMFSLYGEVVDGEVRTGHDVIKVQPLE